MSVPILFETHSILVVSILSMSKFDLHLSINLKISSPHYFFFVNVFHQKLRKNNYYFHSRKTQREYASKIYRGKTDRDKLLLSLLFLKKLTLN